MSNEEYTPIVEQDENDATTEEVETSTDSNQDEDSSQEDSTDWKSEALKYKAILDRNKNKKSDEKPVRSRKSNDLDYGEKAFLIANGINSADEFKLVQDFMSNTGKSLDDVVSNKYFKSELNDFRELQKTSQATPTGTRKAGQSAQDSVDYWIAKGELPPKDQVELRRSVVNAMVKRDSKKSNFYNG